MKKVIVMALVVAMILSLGILNAVAAEPTENGDVAGILDKTNAPNFTIHLTGDYTLDIAGQATGESGNYTYFAATCTGDIVGTMTGTLNAGGLDTMFAKFVTIDGNTPSTPVSLVGVFVQSGVDGQFEGQIVIGDVPDPVNSLTIGTTGNVTEIAVGDTLQMTAVTDPTGDYDINWAVYVNDRDKAWINEAGVLHALAPGSVTVIANTVDPNVATDTQLITVVPAETEVSGDVDPSYIIIIPSSVDFGTLVRGTTTVSKPFNVVAQDVVIEDGDTITVTVTSPFVMKDKDGTGNISLAYSLRNRGGAVQSGHSFTTFDSDDLTQTENGFVDVDTSTITKAGSYSGTMVFTINYVD